MTLPMAGEVTANAARPIRTLMIVDRLFAFAIELPQHTGFRELLKSPAALPFSSFYYAAIGQRGTLTFRM
jgi:hypothetical protein